LGPFPNFVQLEYFKTHQVKISKVSCGTDHLFAISTMDIIYGWGRNSSGQLGLGFISESVPEPTVVQSLTDMSVRKIRCGDNYSAAISLDRKLFVAGEVAGGKLGLGKTFVTGFVLNF